MRVYNTTAADGCLGGTSSIKWIMMATEPKVHAAAHTVAHTHAHAGTHARVRVRTRILRPTTHTRRHARTQVSRWADAYSGKGYATDACGTVDASSLKYSVRAGPWGTLVLHGTLR